MSRRSTPHEHPEGPESGRLSSGDDATDAGSTGRTAGIRDTRTAGIRGAADGEAADGGVADVAVSAGGRPPASIRLAGALTALEGLVALGYALFLVIREAAGHKEAAISGYGTAAWFGIIFGGVLVGGWALLSGRRWGRAISLVAQILLLPVSYYAFTSHRPELAIPVAILAVVILLALFAPASIRWLAEDLGPEESGLPPEEKPSRGRR